MGNKGAKFPRPPAGAEALSDQPPQQQHPTAVPSIHETKKQRAPDSAFAIGDDEEEDPQQAAPQQDPSAMMASESSMKPINKKPLLVAAVREPLFIAEVNRVKIEKFKQEGQVYKAFEASIPLSLLDYREFEGRVKKLVFESDTVAVRQLCYVLGRDYDDFKELADPESEISAVILSPAFDRPQPKRSASLEESKEPSEVDHLDKRIDIVRLLLFGLLYCKGKHKEKCARFWDILQMPGNDQISCEDKELTVAGTWVFEMASHWVHTYAKPLAEQAQNADTTEDFADLSVIKEMCSQLYDTFLDDCFGDSSRVSRADFLGRVESNCPYLFDPPQLRAKMVEQIKISRE